MHGASGLGLSATSSEAASEESLPEERYLSRAANEARAASKALHCLPKTSPSRQVYRGDSDP